MVKRASPKRASAPTDGFEPHVRRNPASVLGGTPFARVYVLARSFCGVRIVERWPAPGNLFGIRDRYVPDDQLVNYTPEECALQSAIQELKVSMVAEGATPEAVILVGAVSPFEEEELNTMADKLKTKTSAKKPADKAKGDKAKGAAVPRSAPDFKYKAGPNAKEVKGREGSWTARMIEIALANKDAASAREELAKDKTFGEKRMDFGWLEKKGVIEKTS